MAVEKITRRQKNISRLLRERKQAQRDKIRIKRRGYVARQESLWRKQEKGQRFYALQKEEKEKINLF